MHPMRTSESEGAAQSWVTEWVCSLGALSFSFCACRCVAISKVCIWTLHMQHPQKVEVTSYFFVITYISVFAVMSRFSFAHSVPLSRLRTGCVLWFDQKRKPPQKMRELHSASTCVRCSLSGLLSWIRRDSWFSDFVSRTNSFTIRDSWFVIVAWSTFVVGTGCFRIMDAVLLPQTASVDMTWLATSLDLNRCSPCWRCGSYKEWVRWSFMRNAETHLFVLTAYGRPDSASRSVADTAWQS